MLSLSFFTIRKSAASVLRLRGPCEQGTLYVAMVHPTLHPRLKSRGCILTIHDLLLFLTPLFTCTYSCSFALQSRCTPTPLTSNCESDSLDLSLALALSRALSLSLFENVILGRASCPEAGPSRRWNRETSLLTTYWSESTLSLR